MAKAKTETDSIEAVLNDSIRSTKDALAAERKVRIKIQKMKDRQDTFVPVGINGHFIRVPINETVEVPESVAALLENAGYI